MTRQTSATKKPALHMVQTVRTTMIGRRIRDLRTTAGETLATLSQKTGISPSTLSKIENDKVSPTFSNLVRLASGLKLQLNDIISTQAEPTPTTGRIAVTRAEDVTFTRTPSYSMGPLCSDLVNKRMNPLLNYYPHGTDAGGGDRLVRHEGEEFVYVLDGILEIYTEHYRAIRLEPGDSAYFDSRMAHSFRSVGPSPAKALMVWLGPGGQTSEEVVAMLRRLYHGEETDEKWDGT